MRNTLFLTFILLLTACFWESNETTTNGLARTLSEDEVINNIMNDFISEPDTQDELDRNIILNHIIDKKLEMQSTQSGIYYQIIKEGVGEHPQINDDVVVFYKGSFLNGEIFDASKKDQPHRFYMKKVIDGWKEAIPMLKSGGKGLFIIPSRLCYGEAGFGELISSNTILQFEIELLTIKNE